MVQVHENLQRIAHQLMGFPALDVDDKAQPAGVVLELRVVKTLFRGGGNLYWRLPVNGFVRWIAGHRSAVSLRSFIFYSILIHVQ